MPRRFVVLDGLRGVAALGVMGLHASHGAVLGNAVVAVDFFFCLSGFVLAHAYAGRRDPGQSLAFWRFAGLRLVRLYPLFALGLVLGTLALLAGADSLRPPGTVLRAFALNAAFVPILTPLALTDIDGGNLGDVLFPANIPAWSLASELVVNLAFLPLLVAPADARWVRRVLATAAALALAVLIGSGLIAAHRTGHWVPELTGGWGYANALQGLARATFGFAMGIALQRLVARPGFFATHALADQRWAVMLIVGLIAMLALPLIAGLRAVEFLGCMILAGPALVLAGALTPARSRWVARLLGGLGDLSYPVYCLHVPVIRIAALWHRTGLPMPLGLPVALIGMTATVALAALVLPLYDVPLRRRLGRWLLVP